MYHGHELTALVGKHVDDVKTAGREAKVSKLAEAIEEIFGKARTASKMELAEILQTVVSGIR